MSKTGADGRTISFGTDVDQQDAAELVRNGEEIDWNYWSRRRQITPDQAAKLAHFIDPMKWPDNEFAQGAITRRLAIKLRKAAGWLSDHGASFSLAKVVELLGDFAPLRMRQAAGQTGASTRASNVRRWTDDKLRSLLEESREFGITQEKLAVRHGVKRQRIGALLKEAKQRFGTRAPSLAETARLVRPARRGR